MDEINIKEEESMAENRKYTRSVEELSSLSGISENLIRKRLREGIYKGERVGKEWMIPENEFNKILGIDKNTSDWTKESRLRELESENKALHLKLNTLETLLSSSMNILQT